MASHTQKETRYRKTPEPYGARLSSSHVGLAVVSGLNQGEQLKLDDSPLLIGGSDDCDLYLAEPSLSEANLMAERDQDRVVISAIQSSNKQAYVARGAERNPIIAPVSLGFGESFCLGGVWIKVFDTQASPEAQQKQLSEIPADLPAPQQRELKETTIDGPAPIDSQFYFPNAEIKRFESKRSTACFGTHEDGISKMVWLKAGSWILSSLAICAVTVSVAQGVNKHSVHTKPDVISEELLAQERLSQQHLTQQHPSPASGLQDLPQRDAAFTSPDFPELRQGQVLAQAEHSSTELVGLEAQETTDKIQEKLPFLQVIFNQMLIDRELPSSVSLSYEKGQFLVHGTLAESKHDILARMLVRFKSEHNLSQTLLNQVRSSSSSLPFEIVQVTSGRYGNVVTESGKRLFVGDQLSGYQLVAIQNHKLVFAGKSRVTISW